MEKLKQIAEGEYFLGNQPVTPHLVYGPVMYTSPVVVEGLDLPIDSLVQRIKSETGVALEKIANSYHSGGISITEQDGKKTRHDIVLFFKSISKPLN